MRIFAYRRTVCPKLIAALTVLACCLSLSVSNSFAQATVGSIDIGFPPNALFQASDIDFVNLDNGNLHIEIPLSSTVGEVRRSVTASSMTAKAGSCSITVLEMEAAPARSSAHLTTI